MKVLSAETNLSSATNVGSASVVRIFNSDSSTATVTKKDSGGSTIGTFTVGAGEVIYCEKNYTDTLEGGATLKVSKTAYSSMMSYSSYSYGGGGGGGATPAVTAAEYYYDQGSSPVGQNVTRNMNSDPDANNLWNDVPVVTTPGKRLFVILPTWRQSGGSASWHADYFAQDGNNAAGYELKLLYNSTTTALTYRGVVGASDYNLSSIWTALVDGASSATDDYSIQFITKQVNGNGPYDHGNFAYAAIVIDDVSNIEYFNTEGLPFSQSNDNTTPALNLAPDNTTSATKVLRIAIGNGSNIPTDTLDYNKGGSEPAYTQIGEGDNGTNERHYYAYHFGDHGTQVNMTGTFGSGGATSNDFANNGMSGLGAIIGLS